MVEASSTTTMTGHCFACPASDETVRCAKRNGPPLFFLVCSGLSINLAESRAVLLSCLRSFWEECKDLSKECCVFIELCFQSIKTLLYGIQMFIHCFQAVKYFSNILPSTPYDS